MKRAIFTNKNQRLRRRRIILVCVGVTVVLAILLGILLLVLSLRDNDPDDKTTSPPPSTEEQDDTPTVEPLRELPEDFISRNSQTPRIALYDVTAQTMLYSKNADERCAPASLTKLMTAIVALKHAPLDTLLTAGSELYLLDPASSRAGIYVGYTLTLEQAIQGLLLKSGNDAAYVIAAQIGHRIDPSLSGQAAIDRFCLEMTEEAARLGCTNTTFVNPDGIDAPAHKTTANDLAKIACHALNQPFIAETVATPEVTTTLASGQTMTWKNTNHLLPGGDFAYEGACGMKTGYTSDAGYCLISCASYNGRTVLCVVLGTEPYTNIRWYESIELLNLGLF